MKLLNRTLLVASLIHLLGLVASANAVLDPLERGRQLTKFFYDGDFAALYATFSSEMDELLGGVAGLESFKEEVASQLGQETVVLDESVIEDHGAHLYVRTSRFSMFDGPVVIQWALNDAGTVIGFYVAPGEPSEAAASDYLDYETQANLRLPFAGEWTVGWGGRTLADNYHAAYGDQRFAYDFLIVHGGTSHKGQGLRNEDFYCYGEPILAPASGTVVAAVDGVTDNSPGEFGDDAPLGNHVIIEHSVGEYSFLAHLKNGSVTVALGQQVESGEQIGTCGNSGRSSEPHLHYHLQNSAEFGLGEGLPAQFQDYVADGERVKRGEPVRGQRVSEAAGP